MPQCLGFLEHLRHLGERCFRDTILPIRPYEALLLGIKKADLSYLGIYMLERALFILLWTQLGKCFALYRISHGLLREPKFILKRLVIRHAHLHQKRRRSRFIAG